LNPSFFDFPLYRLPDFDLPPNRIEGNGQRGIGLFYEAAAAEEEVLSSFLDNILKAAKINRLEDAVSIRITPDEPISLQQLPSWQALEYCLIFGIPPKRLGLGVQLQAYQPSAVSGLTFLWSDPLKSIWEERQQGGKKMSGQLWRALQQLFLSS
jgi:hypothetical protein